MFLLDFPRGLVITSTSKEKALEVLSRIGEAAGGRTPPAYISIVPYWINEEVKLMAAIASLIAITALAVVFIKNKKGKAS
jgi:hypothetical protein